MTIKDAKELITYAKLNGIKRIKVAGLEVEFHEEKGVVYPSSALEMGIPADGEAMPTEDEMLLWSSPAYDEIKAQRKQATQPELISE
jgi:hypothetical protein